MHIAPAAQVRRKCGSAQFESRGDHRCDSPAVLSVVFDVKVKHEQLGLLRAVATTDCADKFGIVAPYSPHDAAAAAAFQRHEVADEFAGPEVPDLDGSVVR